MVFSPPRDRGVARASQRRGPTRSRARSRDHRCQAAARRALVTGGTGIQDASLHLRSSVGPPGRDPLIPRAGRAHLLAWAAESRAVADLLAQVEWIVQ